MNESAPADHTQPVDDLYARKKDVYLDPPEGFAKWSLRLLADQVVQLEYIDRVSHETIRQVLKKTKSSLGVTRDG